MSESKRKEAQDAIEEAAIAGAKELKAFFSYQGANPERYQRARLGATAVSGYTRMKSSQANLAAVMLQAARQVGLSPTDTLGLAREAGLLPETSSIKA